jgi:hypothetical protein
MKIFKHILNTNNRNDLIEKINKIEKKAEIYFRKEKDDENDVDEEIEDEAETVEDETEIIEEPEPVEVKRVKRNVVDYIRVNKSKTIEAYPELTEKEINTLLLKKWKTLSDEEKYF